MKSSNRIDGLGLRVQLSGGSTFVIPVTVIAEERIGGSDGTNPDDRLTVCTYWLARMAAPSCGRHSFRALLTHV